MAISFDNALIERHAPPGAPILLALSGGSDSRAALALLAESCRAQGRTLFAAHLDHGIRPASADDAAFCTALCAEMGIICFTRRVDVPALAERSGRGLEETAREARYAFFAEVMERESIPVLVTAHHADDNLETMLMRLARGCGLRGLCGIPPMREVAGGVLLRPFLRVTKAELAAYCAEHGLAYLTDETNADTTYTRNRIRAEVTPILMTLNPALTVRAADTADALRADEAYLTAAADALWHGLPDGRHADGVWLRAQPTAMRWRLYARMHRTVTEAMLEQIHLRALDRLLDGSDGTCSLPGRVTATLWGGNLTFAPAASFDTPPDGWSMPAEVGWRTLDRCRATVGILPDTKVGENVVESDTNIYKLFINRHLNFDKIKGYPYWRMRAPGDKIILHGHHRSVKKLLQEHRIAPVYRARLPILCDDTGIVCLPGVGIRDDLLGGNTAVAVRLEQ